MTKNTITEIKDSREGISSKIQTEEWISKLEDKRVEITEEQTKEKE